MKKEKGTKTIIFLLTILVIALAGYLGYDKLLNKENPNTIEQEKEESNQRKTIHFDRKNCINSDFSSEEYTISKLGPSYQGNGLSFSIDSLDEKVVNIQARYDLMFPDQYGEEEIRDGSTTYYEDINLRFNQNVESIFEGLFEADGVEGTVYLFLLEDGSLEFMKYSDIYQFQNYVHQPVEEVKEIVKFDNLVLNSKQDPGSKYTAIAYKIDGTYYDLSEFIQSDS